MQYQIPKGSADRGDLRSFLVWGATGQSQTLHDGASPLYFAQLATLFERWTPGHSILKVFLRKRAAADYWLSGPLGERVPQTPYFFEFDDRKTGGLDGLLQRGSGLAPSRSE